MTTVHGIIGYVLGVVFVITWVYFIRAVNRLYLTWFLTTLYLRTITCGTTIVKSRSWFLDAFVMIVFWIHDPSISLTIMTDSWPLYILGLDIAGHGPFAFFDSSILTGSRNCDNEMISRGLGCSDCFEMKPAQAVNYWFIACQLTPVISGFGFSLSWHAQLINALVWVGLIIFTPGVHRATGKPVGSHWYLSIINSLELDEVVVNCSKYPFRILDMEIGMCDFGRSMMDGKLY